MAKDKDFEAKYKEEKLRRTYIRKARRRAARQYKLSHYGRRSESTCPYCGGVMTWCSCCEMWSRTCCEEYGTCQCS